MSTARKTPVEGARLSRPRWRDPRLLIGLVLVLASVAGVVALVAASQRTQTYWAASRDLAPGSPVDAGGFTAVEVNLADAGDLYLPADRPAPDGQFVAAAVRKGELVPVRAVGAADPQGRRPVGVELAEPLPAGVGVGDRVDVWVAETLESGRGHTDPERLAGGIEIAELTREESGFGTGADTRLQLMVDDEVLPRLLDAKVSDARITVVPSTGTP